MNSKTTLLSLTTLLSFNVFFGQTPTLDPAESVKVPLGYEWILTPNMSDEFDSPPTTMAPEAYESTAVLDATKWNDQLAHWDGRPPAEFLPENIFLEGGKLHIKNRPHPTPTAKFTIGAGAVESKDAQTYGYFESKMKASRVRMSSTFWINSQSVKSGDPDLIIPATETDSDGKTYTGCDGYGTEIDIIECMGGGDTWPTWMVNSGLTWDVTMASNTHFKRKRKLDTSGSFCNDKYVSAGKGAFIDGVGATNVADDYHVYAAWWKNANIVHYYIDGKLVNTVDIRDDYHNHPFNVPMAIRMVTETYNWQVTKDAAGNIINEHPGYPDPTDTDPLAELNNPAINTTHYDWTRTYSLKKTAQNLVSNGDVENGTPITGAWTSWGAAGNVTFSEVGGEKYTNAKGVKIIGGGGLEQVINVAPNTEYVYTVMAKKISGNTKIGMKEPSVNVNISAVTPIISNEFKEYTVEFNSGARTQVKLFAFGSPGDSAILDNFSVLTKAQYLALRPDAVLSEDLVQVSDSDTYIHTYGNTIEIGISNYQSTGKIEIYSLAGKLVYEELDANLSSKVVQTTLKSGVYVLKLTLSNGQKINKKVILNL